MKIKKLLLTALLVVGLQAAPAAQAYGINLFILMDKEKKHLNCFIGDYHSSNQIKQKTCINASNKTIKELINKKNTAFIIETHTNEVKSLLKLQPNKKEDFSLLQNMALQTANKKRFIRGDWRKDTALRNLISFYMTASETIATVYKNTLKELDECKLTNCADALKKLSPVEFANKLFDANYLSELKNNGLNFEPKLQNLLKSLKNHAKHYAVTLDELVDSLEQISESIEQQIKNSKNSQYKKYAQETYDTLTDTMDQINSFYEFNENEEEDEEIEEEENNILLAHVEQAIKNKKLTSTTYETILKKDWFLDSIDLMANFGFVSEIFNAQQSYPITITYAGENHTTEVIDEFVNRFDYEIIYGYPTKDYATYKKTTLEQNNYNQFLERIQETEKLITLKKHDREENQEEKNLNYKKKKLNNTPDDKELNSGENNEN